MGPFTAAELRVFADAGAFGPEDLVWKDDLGKWVRAKRVKGLFDGVGTGASSSSSGDGLPAPWMRVNAGVPSVPVSSFPIEMPLCARYSQAILGWEHEKLRHTDPAAYAQLRGMQALNDQLGVTNRLLEVSAQIGMQTNQILGEVVRTLMELGFTMERATESIERQEKMHRTYYEGIQRERALKEVIYQITRYRELVEGTTDEIARGYGAKHLIDMIDGCRFGTQDLTELSDKRTFDELMDWAKETLRGISPTTFRLIEDFDSTHASFHWLKDRDPEGELREQKKALPSDPWLKKVKSPEEKHPIAMWLSKAFTILCWIWFALVTLLAVAGSCSVFSDRSETESTWPAWLAIWALFGGPAVLSVWSLHRERCKMRKQYEMESARYRTEKAQLDEKYKENWNNVMIHNTAIEGLVSSVGKDHRDALELLRGKINQFLAAHPQLERLAVEKV